MSDSTSRDEQLAREWLRHAHSEESCKSVSSMGLGVDCHFIGDDHGDEKCLAQLLAQVRRDTLQAVKVEWDQSTCSFEEWLEGETR